MKKLLVTFALLFLHATPLAAQENNDIEVLKQQVKQLSATVEQLKNNQLIIARQVGLVKPQQIMPGEPAPIESGYQVGATDAKVVIMEFTDLQCPFCQKFHMEIYPALKEQYIDTGKVLFVNRQNPIATHKQARIGAKYLLCAAAQGAFAEVKTDLFTFGGKLKDEAFDDIPAVAALDQAALQSCLANDSALENQINYDIQLGVRMGVAATPTFMIGLQNEAGQLVEWARYEGSKPVEFYQEVIDTLLQK